MTDRQSLANLIGHTVRKAEAAAGSGNLGQTLVELGKLHNQLGQAYHATNVILQVAGLPLLEWSPIAGSLAPGSGEVSTQSGGTPKGEPPAQ